MLADDRSVGNPPVSSRMEAVPDAGRSRRVHVETGSGSQRWSMNANQPFKRSSRRFWWLGGIAAVALNGDVLFLTPPMEVVGFRGQPKRARMVVTIGAWEALMCRGGCTAGYARYDSAFSPPEVEHWSEVNYTLSRVYCVRWELRKRILASR